MLRIALAALALVVVGTFSESITLPNVLHDGPVTAESTSARKHIDWPKLTPGANESSYDW
jgi:hypothetical protein